MFEGGLGGIRRRMIFGCLRFGMERLRGGIES